MHWKWEKDKNRDRLTMVMELENRGRWWGKSIERKESERGIFVGGGVGVAAAVGDCRHHHRHHRSVYKKNFFPTTFCVGDGNGSVTLCFTWTKLPKTLCLRKFWQSREKPINVFAREKKKKKTGSFCFPNFLLLLSNFFPLPNTFLIQESLFNDYVISCSYTMGSWHSRNFMHIFFGAQLCFWQNFETYSERQLPMLIPVVYYWVRLNTFIV